MKVEDTSVLDTVIAQALKITKLEETVLRLTTENVHLVGQNEHHLTMRTQQDGIIHDLQVRYGIIKETK